MELEDESIHYCDGIYRIKHLPKNRFALYFFAGCGWDYFGSYISVYSANDRAFKHQKAIMKETS